MDSIANMLGKRRAELGVSQEVAAVTIGTTRTSYQKWQSGAETPTARWVEPLAEWLDIPRWKVLGGIGLLGDDELRILSDALGGYLVPLAA